MNHYHHCPECYESPLCSMNCTIEPDLSEGDRQFGAHWVCSSCDKTQTVKYDKTWFARYNGFLK